MRSIILGMRNVGVITGALAFLLIANAQEVFAESDAAVDEAVASFDEAQQEAEQNVPSNRTSKGLEDKLDEALRKQEAIDADPESSDRQKERAQDAVDEAEEAADAFNKGTMNPEAANDYRTSLEKRREARKKLKEQERRFLRAKNTPRLAAQQLRIIRGRLKKADAAPPSKELARDFSREPSREIDSGGFQNVGGFGFGAALDAGVVVQRLPKDNANIGVLHVTDGDRPFLGIKSVMYVGSTSAGGTLREIPMGNGRLQIGLGGGYGRAEDDRSRYVLPQVGVINGLTYWDYAPDDSPGFASNGAGASGSVDTTFEGYRFNLDTKYGFPCGSGDEEDDALGWRAPGFDIGTTYLKLGVDFNHTSQSTDQRFALMHPDPFFTKFKVDSRTNIDVDDWRLGAVLGVYHTLPIPNTDNFAFSFGVSTMLGYYDASADASQRNHCDVRTQQSDGTNLCPRLQQDFKLDFDLDESGFEYGVTGMARVDYRMDQIMGGLRLGLVYDIDYSGISRFDAPSNLDKEGAADLDWKHVVGHRVSAQLSLHF